MRWRDEEERRGDGVDERRRMRRGGLLNAQNRNESRLAEYIYCRTDCISSYIAQ